MIRGRSTLLILLALATGAGAAGCRSRAREVVVYLSIDEVFTEPILRDFERQSGVKVRAVFDTEARALGDRTAVLDGGSIVHLGPLDGLRSRPDLPFAQSIIDALG